VSAADAATERTVGFVVPLAAGGLRTDALQLMGGHRAFRVSFDDVEVADQHAVLAGPDGAGLADQDLRRVANAGVALLSLDLVGVGEAVLQRTVDYTMARRQFGRPIASFQAAQHVVANMHIALAAARLAAHSAVFWIGRGRTASRETAIARMHAAAAAKSITLDAHQLHGGMGYVVETDLHLFSERARVLSTLGGGADVAATWLEGEA
jgi:alkylation response protein AidB-like acyl-CoA dehydrogenase